MKILVTGAKGFAGKNLVTALKNIMEKKDCSRPNLVIDEIYEFDVDTNPILLDEYCKQAEFVFHLAGVNRPKNQDEFMKGNFDFGTRLLELLKKNTVPVMLSSSVQATLIGRYSGSEYGKSKLAAEELFLDYAASTGSKVLVYRFPNLFGKWCRPNYNSAIATFCYNVANELPVQVNDSSLLLEMVYIDDFVNEMLDALEGKEHHCEYVGTEAIGDVNGRYCYVPVTYKATLGEIVTLLESFKRQPETLFLPSIPTNSFEKKLYTTYLSYLPEEKVKFMLEMKCDNRGSFTELLKTAANGQISVNISKPGITKGEHWHQSKWEIFIVVAGHGLIQERKIGLDENGNSYPIMNFEVSGEKIEAVYMLPGYTHNIINLSEKEDLVTIMWANEEFDSENPDTFFESVKKK